MQPDLRSRRRLPFLLATVVALLAAALGTIVADAVGDDLLRSRALNQDQASWVYSVVSVLALGQAAYVALVALSDDRILAAWQKDPQLRRLGRAEIMSSVVRHAAWMPLLTLVYAAGAFALTGRREGMWPFVALTALQLAYAYVRCGQVAEFLAFQPEYISGGREGSFGPSAEQEDDG